MENDTNWKVEKESENIRQTLAANIADYRKKMKLTRAALAKKIGVTEAAIGQYERAVRTPQVDILYRLSNVFNVPIDFLVEHESKTYDAVLEYRFESAVDFVTRTGLIVHESDDGRIKIKERVNPTPKFQTENGIVKKTEPTEKFSTLIEFYDREIFFIIVEDFIEEFIFLSDDFSKMFRDYFFCLGREEKFNPIFRIRYDGRDMGFI